MSKYFMNDSKLQELEQLMMLVPNFSPRGRGIRYIPAKTIEHRKLRVVSYCRVSTSGPAQIV